MMLTKLWTVCLYAGILTTGGGMFAQTSEQVTQAKAQYAEFKARVSGGDLTVDWKAFRIAAATSGLTRGFERREDYRQALLDTDAGKLEGALTAAQAGIERNMADPEAHLLAARVLEKMGRGVDAERERLIEHGLVMSIYASGDGKTQATALMVMDAGEETFYAQAFLGEEPTRHLVTEVDGRTFDHATMVDWAGKTSAVWFLRLIVPVTKER